METYKYLVDNVNNTINAHSFNVPIDCSNPGDALRRDRFASKWYDVNDDEGTDLRRVALDGFREHLKSAVPTETELNAFAACYVRSTGTADQQRIGRVLLRARAILRIWLADYKPLLICDRRYVGPRMNAAYDGHLNELDKLITAERWPCQPSALPLLRKIAIRHPILRRRCKDRGRVLSRAFALEGIVVQPAEYFDIGFISLTKRETPFEKDTITTVPKNNKTDRVIAKCTIGDQIAESAVAYGVEEALERAGCFLRDSKGFDGQHWHGVHIADKRNATVDLQRASDSNYWNVVKWFLSGSSLKNDLDKVRVRSVVIEDECVPVPMLATMGRRICFVTMTMILAALGCAVTGRSEINRFDPLSPQVYGDDVIIQNIHAPLFIEVAELCGYTTNSKKTFVNSPFRESCGKYYHDDIGYITSFDFKPANNIGTAIALTNKALLNFIEALDDSHKVFWYDMWQACFRILDGYRGPLPHRCDEELGSWCFDPDFDGSEGSNKQTDWLSERFQTSALTVIRTVTEEAEEIPLNWSQLMYARFLAYRDLSLPTRTREGQFVDDRIVVDEDGNRYGSLAYLRALRARDGLYRRRSELFRLADALRIPKRYHNYLAAHGSYDLWRVRNFVLKG